MKNVLDFLIFRIRQSLKFNSDIQIAPKCIIWTDKEKQWLSIIPILQDKMPELFVLGTYNKTARQGPSIWIRCAVERKLNDFKYPDEAVPIIYIPGFSRQELRAIEECPEEIKSISELQYRGTFWSQPSHKDWTVLAFLVNKELGVGLSISEDNETKNCMLSSLVKLLQEDVESLRGKTLDGIFFNTLITGEDWIKNVLQWINLDKEYERKNSQEEWKAFQSVCLKKLNFNLTKSGHLQAVTLLAQSNGPWLQLWERYKEAPNRYPNIYSLLKNSSMPPIEMFSNVQSHGNWPQWNESQEIILRETLASMSDIPLNQLKAQIIDLEQVHGKRRNLIWSELGHSPLALSLFYLNEIQKLIVPFAHLNSVNDLAVEYSRTFYKIDDSVLKAFAQVKKDQDIQALTKVIGSLYNPWVNEIALHLQKLVKAQGYPQTKDNLTNPNILDSECWFFVDGLRFDLAKRIVHDLNGAFQTIEENVVWTALPSVTATGKAFISPVATKLDGDIDESEFEPSVKSSKRSLRGGSAFKSLLKDEGIKILTDENYGNGTGKGWFEFGDIDSEGHASQLKLTQKIDSSLQEIKDKILMLTQAGWKKIKIVTDHGWLLIPGDAPKTPLSSALVESKWGRCASIKQGAIVECEQYPWFWNPSVHFALAPGASCFKNGQEYMHGGLSLQECLTLQIIIHNSQPNLESKNVIFEDVMWRGMRCNVVIKSADLNLKLDIRTHPDQSNSSKVSTVKDFDVDGGASVVIPDDELEGKDATIVILDTSGKVIAQKSTIVGGK